MIQTEKQSWTTLSPREKDELNLISSAWFDLFSGNKPKPSKYEMVRWLRKSNRSKR